jgi:hypothetical protein
MNSDLLCNSLASHRTTVDRAPDARLSEIVQLRAAGILRAKALRNDANRGKGSTGLHTRCSFKAAAALRAYNDIPAAEVKVAGS